MTFDVIHPSHTAVRKEKKTPAHELLQHARNNIYGAGMKKWGSYTVSSPVEIKHHASIQMGGHRTTLVAPASRNLLYLTAV